MKNRKHKVSNKETKRRLLQSNKDRGVVQRGDLLFTPVKGISASLVEEVSTREQDLE